MNFLSYLISGISLGSVYALIALGYTMVYGIAKMLNFAHGDVIMIGGFVIFTAVSSMHTSAGVAIVCAIIVCTVLGVSIEKIAYKPLRNAPPLAVLITAIGVSYFLQNVALLIFGSASRNFPDILHLPDWHVADGLTVTGEAILTIAATIVIMIALTTFINHTRIGAAMQAVSEDRGAAQLMGVNANALISLTFIIGSALAAVAGSFYLMQIPTVTPSTGALPGIKAFTAAVIGGIGSIPGAMLGGILLGIVEKICESVPVLAPFTTAIEFGLLILILLIKPTGLLGVKRREKV